MKFCNLHHHTTFSHGDGFGTPAQHVERAAELGYTSIAATEHGGVSSHWQLKKAADKAGIKPIYGLEAYCAPTGYYECEECEGTGQIEEKTCKSCKGEGKRSKNTQWKHHLTILAENVAGYQSLNRVVSQSWRDFYYHPTVSGETLAQNVTGLIALSGCAGSLLACTLLGGKGIPEHNDKPDWDAALDMAIQWKEFLGDGNYFLEVQPFYELERTCAINRSYRWIAEEAGIPMVVTCDVHYPKPEDGEMQAVLHAVHRGKASVDDAMREWNYEVPLTLPDSDKSLADRLIKTGLNKAAAWAAIETSAAIAERCNVELPQAERLRYPISEQDLQPWT